MNPDRHRPSAPDRRRRSIGGSAVMAALALVAAACGEDSAGPRAPVEVRVIDEVGTGSDGTETAGSTDESDGTGGTDSAGAGSDETAGGTDAEPGPAESTTGPPGPGLDERLATPRRAITGEVSLNPDVTPLEFGVRTEGEIEQLLGADRYTFETAPGALLTVELLELGQDRCRQDLELHLVTPADERLDLAWIGNNGCGGHGPWLLDQAGQYGLEFVGGDGVIIDDATGTYAFVADLLVEFDEQPLVSDQSVEGRIEQLFGTDRYTFEAAAGSRLVVNVEAIGDDCRADLTMNLIDPDGTRNELAWVGNRQCQAHGPFELTVDGTYALEFEGGDGQIVAPATGPYTFTATLG